MAASKTIGGINVTILATVDKFQKGMTAARRTLASFQKGIKDTIFSLKGLAVGLAAGAMGKMTANAFQAVDAMGELSDKLGIGTDKIAGLQIAADEAGVSQQVLEKALVKLSNTMGMSGDKALRKWIDDTSKLSTQQEKLAAATKMFGSRGSDMVRFLNGGTSALDEAQKASEQLGLSLDRKTVAGVERAMDAFGRFKKAVSAIFVNIAAEAAPYVELLSTKLTSVLTEGGMAKGLGKGIVDVIVKGVGFISDLIAKMVAGILNMAADVQSFFLQFKGSKMGEKLGFQAGTVEEYEAVGRLRNTAYRMTHERNLPSAMIEKMVADARKAAEEEANAKQKANATPLLEQLSKKVEATLKPTLGNLQQLGEKAIGSAQGAVNSIPKMWQKLQFATMMFRPELSSAQKSAAASQGGFSLPVSGSVESYRIQVRNQNRSESLQRQQLDELRRIRKAGERENPPLDFPLGLN